MKRVHAGALAAPHQRPEGVVVDRPAELGVELEARVVRDAGEVDDRVAARQRPFARRRDRAGRP